MYHKIAQEEKNIIDVKIDNIILKKLSHLENAYEKSEE
jgi:hypothetical protein